jgi:hypothetical protein
MAIKISPRASEIAFASSFLALSSTVFITLVAQAGILVFTKLMNGEMLYATAVVCFVAAAILDAILIFTSFDVLRRLIRDGRT